MSITNKVTVGLVSIAFVTSLVAGVSTHAQSSVESLQAQIAQLLEQINDLQGELRQQGSTTGRTVVASGGNAACPYTWTKNLAIGSSGDDVRQLQRFLNGNPQTQVATSGVGSPGNETSYYGPATARAVSRFQELYAAQILTPLGLTKGTGGFYTSTRNQANNVCASDGGGSRTYTTRSSAGQRSATSAPVVQVTGDALAVTPGNPIGDAYVIQGAQQAPFTSVVLTAGSDAVRIDNIRVKRFGLSSSDNFESVALVDAAGIQIGTARSLNSRNEVKLGSGFVIPANRSVTLAVVGNMTSDDDKFSAGSIAGLEVVEVTANTRVQGNFPIRGAAHVLSESIDLQKIEVEVSGGGDAIEFNEDTEVVSVNVAINTSGADEEDAYLRSMILQQTGSADEEEVGEVSVLVDGEREDYTLVIDRDRYIVRFPGKGVLIEEGDSVDVSLVVNTDRGYEETVQFALEDESHVYVVGASYGYGLPVEITYKVSSCDDRDSTCSETDDDGYQDVSDASMISSGKVRDGGRLRKFEDEVRYGKDVILGALAVEFEGEDIEMEDLTFDLAIDPKPWSAVDNNAWDDADEETVRIENVRLRVDGKNVAYSNDSIDLDESSDGSEFTISDIEFGDNFVIDVRDETEVKFEIVADLDAAWSYFGGTTLEFTLTDVDLAEGVRSEKDYTDTNEYFATDRVFESVEIIGNEVEFAITSDGVDTEEFVAGKTDVVFGTLEVDASDAIDDVTLETLYVSFQIPANESGDLSNINDCRVLDRSGDQVADSRTSLSGTGSTAIVSDQMKFRFDDTVVESEESAEFDIFCDIDQDANSGDKYQVAAIEAENDRIEYEIGREDDEMAFTAATSGVITISAGGTLSLDIARPGDVDVAALAVGNGVDDIEVLEVTFEAKDEDITIVNMYLAGVGIGVGTVSETELERFISRVSIDRENVRPSDFESATQKIVLGNCEDGAGCFQDDGSTPESDDVTVDANSLAFENVGLTVEEGRDGATATMTVDYRGLSSNKDKSRSGQWLKAAKLFVEYEGETSGHVGSVVADVGTQLVQNVVFPTVPTISTRSYDGDLRPGKREIYEFTVTASDDGPVYVKQVGITASTITSGVTLQNVIVEAGGKETASGTLTTGNTTKFAFKANDAVRIAAGDSETFTVSATVGGTLSDSSYITVQLAADATAPTALGQAWAAAIGNFVWSPDTLNDGRDEGADNTDWFSGWGVFESGGIESWTLEN